MTPDQEFAPRLLDWHRQHGRHDLPWQQTRDAYRIWLSEIMLQQTQVATVIPYYQRFLARFPDIPALAAAAQDEVMALWSGLGYYARARNLHRCAQVLVTEHGGRFPEDAAIIAELPGIGRSTAAAIAAFAFGRHGAILDGNVKRVLTRVFGIEGFPGKPAVERELWALAESLLPPRDIEAYTQGIMDLGATLCTRARPDCVTCPMRGLCVAERDGRQAALPTARPAKVVPHREAHYCLFSDGEHILLERRPPQGIWGGAADAAGRRTGSPGRTPWSAPAATGGHAAAAACLHAFPADAADDPLQRCALTRLRGRRPCLAAAARGHSRRPAGANEEAPYLTSPRGSR